ncbi:hypothetical protein PT285_01670 [Lactobacillus sp. ESL0791]|uniref:hypothetical protein n=1 Tax=Lactobacillus sp. ESL0791 TaxID=2983234 RepID=UPI0023F7782B|nr:hypothetical protein [Lactobacillus sp. ESL0791]MDF7638146.1 hypothetical protein [Lactobacillus sp. ESL0791]
MADGTRSAARRVNSEQNSQYKRILTFIIFLLTALVMLTGTFLNPFFMKRQIRTDNNQATVVRKVNVNFNILAGLIGASEDEDANLLTVKQTQPIADHVVDYSLGIHWLRSDSLGLAKQILHDIDLNIDKDSSSVAQRIDDKLNKQHNNAPYFIVEAFNLNTIMLGANIAVVLLVVNLVLIVCTGISLYSLITDMMTRMATRMLVHDVTAAGMWAGFWLILIFGLLALIPVAFNVEAIAVFGFLLEISSSVFLYNVIVGALLYVICAVPWKITAEDN